MKRKVISVILAAVMVLMAVPVSAESAAAAKSDVNEIDEIARQIQDPANDPFDYTDEGMKLQAENEKYPETRDLRDVDGKCYVTPVKDQWPFGTCWGFAAIGAAETSILSNAELNNDGKGGTLYSVNPTQKGSTTGKDAEGKEILNLSEKHLAYFVVTPLDDPDSPQNGEGTYLKDGVTVQDGLDNGGQAMLATNTFASGIGPNLESRDKVLEYHGASKKNGELDYDNPTIVRGWVDGQRANICYSENDYWALDESWRFKQSYVLKESNILPTPAGRKEDNDEAYVYNPAGTNAIKEQLMENRGVEIGFHYSDRTNLDVDPMQVINEENYSYYNPVVNGANHAVLIVGWDDNYPAGNFAETPVDEKGNPLNGAWLVKNSWGSEEEVFPNRREGGYGLFEGQDKAPYEKKSEINTGYFWLSYYDQTIATPEALVFDKSNVGSSYIIDQHDYMPVYMMSAPIVSTETKMSNIFKAEYQEVLEGISCHTSAPGTTVEYAVYLLAHKYEDPEDGLLVAKGSKSYEYGGFKKIDIEDVQIAKGQEYSIVITEKTPEGGFAVSMPVGVSKEQASEWDTVYQKGIINSGESFLFIGGEWEDYSDEDLKRMLCSDERVGSFDNFPIKGYCRETENQNDLAFDLSVESMFDTLCLFPGTNDTVKYRMKLIGRDDLPEGAEPVWYLSDEGKDLVDLKVSPESPDFAELKVKGEKAGKGCLCVHIDGIGTGIFSFEVTELHLSKPYTAYNDRFKYTGKPLTPPAKVDGYEDNEVVQVNENYRIIYKNNVKCGKAILKVEVLKDHMVPDPEDGYFVIYPAKAKVAGLTPGSKSLKVKAKDQKASGLTGYQISYRAKGTKKWKAVDSKKNKKTIRKLKKGKKYQVRVRGYVKVNGEKYYGKWSAVKTSKKIK